MRDNRFCFFRGYISFRVLLLGCIALGIMLPFNAIAETAAATLSITGKVTDEAGNPVANVRVNVRYGQGSAETDSSGNYTIIGLTTGIYTLYVTPPSGSGLLSQNRYIFVDQKKTTTLNFILVLGGIITGQVRDETGNPVANAQIKVCPEGRWCGDNYYYSVETDSSGNYRIIGLPTEIYSVSVIPPSGFGLLSQNKDVSVTQRETTTLNFTLLREGILIGQVSDEAGNPVADAQVEARGNKGDSARTDSFGNYTIGGLPTGTYTVKVTPPSDSGLLSQKDSISVSHSDTATLNFILVLGGIITGRVNDETGNPVPDVRVEVDGENSAWYSTRTNPLGNYTISGLSTDTYTVRVTPPSDSNLLSEKDRYISVSQGETATLNFTLISGGIIIAQVSDEAGNPVANAQIETWAGTTIVTETDSAGNSIMRGLPTGTYSVKATPPVDSGLLPQAYRIISVSQGETTVLSFTLLLGGIITGQVRNEAGNPTANVWLKADQEEGWGKGATETDTLGNYIIRGLPTGTYTVETFLSPCSGLLSQIRRYISVTEGETTTLNFTLVPGGIITGQVNDEAGNPVADAQIEIWRKDESSRWGNYFVRTDFSGSYTICYELPAGFYTMKVTPPSDSGLVFQEIESVSVIRGETTALNFTLFRGGIITGQVRDKAGNPVVNVRVRVGDRDFKTDSFGNYAVSGLPTGTYTVTVLPPSDSGLVFQRKSVLVTQGKITSLHFILSAEGKIAGKVTDEAGNPVANARVMSPYGGSTETDSSGDYTITGLPTGTYTVEVSPPSDSGLLSQEVRNISVTQGKAAILNFTLVMGGIITGWVRDEAGNPVAGAQISAGYKYNPAQTDSLGNYTIFGLPTGTYIIQARPPSDSGLLSYKTEDISVTQRETTPLNFTLLPEGRITGQVNDEKGEAVADAWVGALQSGDWRSSARTDSAGNYTIRELPTGTYTLKVFPPSGSGLTSQEAKNVSVTQGETTTLNIILPLGGIITGQVSNEAGKPVAYAWIEIWQGGKVFSCRTDTSGNYNADGLPTGTYTVEATPPSDFGLLSQSRNVSVTQGEATILNFTLLQGGSITGQASDEAGNPATNVQIKVKDVWVSVGTDSTGSYIIRGLPTGTYTLEVTPPSGSGLLSQIRHISVSQGKTTPLNFTLLLGGSITGQVRDKAGNPVVNAQINDGSTKTDSLGSYTIRGLSTGNYTIGVTPPSGFGLACQQVEDVSVVQGKITTLNFTLPPEEEGIVRGKVTDEAGNSVTNAEIDFQRKGGGGEGYGETDSSGNYAYRLPTGAYTIKVTPNSGSGLAAQQISGVSIARGKTTTLNFTLPPEGRITGQISDKAGNPVNVRGINAWQENGGGWDFTETDSDGSYTLHRLPTGTYTVKVTPASGSGLLPQQVRDVSVTQGETTTLNFTLLMGETITGRISDEAGNPVIEAQIAVRREGGTEKGSAKTDFSGNYTIRGLPTGIYTVEVRPPFGSGLAYREVAGVSVSQGETADLNFTLHSEGKIVGRVSDEAGNPADVLVRARREDGNTWRSVETDSSGNYTLFGLLTGNYIVEMIPPFSSGLLSQQIRDISVTQGEITTLNFTTGATSSYAVYANFDNDITLPDGTRVFLPKGALSTDTFLRISIPPSNVVPPAPNLQLTGIYREIYLENREEQFLNNKRAIIRIPYKDEDNNEIVDGTDILEQSLKVFSWNGEAWVRDFETEVDEINNVVKINPSHLRIFGLFGIVAQTLDDVIVYPNPFKPGRGDAGVRFERLPEDVTIRIYNIAGELVRMEEDIMSGFFDWDGRNDHGKDVASGVYIYFLTGKAGIKKGKIAVIR